MFPMLTPLAVEPSVLQLIWFALIIVLWVGFFFLEGFDYGVAMLLPILGKRDKDRRVMINTIGPVWDGNEVWLLTAGGATFAAFPGWYATLFSALYLPLLLVLVGLILRGIAFEYRAKRDDARWRSMLDWFATVGSFLPSLVFGVGFANFIIGLPVDSRQLFAGTFLGLFSPFALLGGVLFVALFLTHGAVFISLKTKGDIRDSARNFAIPAALVSAVLLVVFAVWANLAYAHHSALPALTWTLSLLAAVAVAAAAFLAKKGREGWAFISTGLSIVLLIVSTFLFMFPNLGFENSANQGKPLDITTAASTPKTLTIMTIAAVIFVPIVLAYQSWSYWIFRRRISDKNLPVIPTFLQTPAQKAAAAKSDTEVVDAVDVDALNEEITS